MKIPATLERRVSKYLETRFHCAECGKGSGTVGDHLEAHQDHPSHCSMECRRIASKREEQEQRNRDAAREERRAVERREWFTSTLPPRYRGMTPDSWDGSSPTPKAVYAGWDQELLLIFGGVGAGKTHLALAVARLWMEENRSCPVFHDALELIWRLRPQSDRAGEDRRDRILTELESPTLLVLDDVGAERSTDFSDEQMAFVIRERHRWQKPTIMTSNYGPKALRNWNTQVASRLHDGAIIKLDGPDRRVV